MKNIIQKFFKTIFVFFVFTILLSVNTYAAYGWTDLGTTNYSVLDSSIDGTKLVGSCNGESYGVHICTSVDSGINWTQTPLEVTWWKSVKMSADGTKLFAIAQTIGFANSVYISNDGGTTWNSIEVSSSTEYINSIAVSDDGSKVVITTWGGYIYFNR